MAVHYTVGAEGQLQNCGKHLKDSVTGVKIIKKN
jgi:hypothetical protein